MAGFKKILGPDVANEERTIGAVAYEVGDLLMVDTTNHVLVAATSSVTPVLLQGGGIVQKATDGVTTKVLIQPIDFNSTYEVESANNSSTDEDYDRMTLTDLNTVNNSSTTDDTNPCVYQVGVIGAATDKKIKVKFVPAIS